MITRIAFCAVFSCFVMATAIADGTDEDAPGSHRRPSPAGATVGFLSIADGDVVPPDFHVQFSVGGMGIAPAGTDIENTGHHHLLIDTAELPDPNLPLPMTDQIKHFGKGQTETDLSLPVGQHTLQLVFADYAHIPHNPVVMSAPITITVSEDAPAVPSEPADH